VFTLALCATQHTTATRNGFVVCLANGDIARACSKGIRRSARSVVGSTTRMSRQLRGRIA
jgi:hypothetical protein